MAAEGYEVAYINLWRSHKAAMRENSCVAHKPSTPHPRKSATAYKTIIKSCKMATVLAAGHMSS